KITDKSFPTRVPIASALQPYSSLLDSTLGGEPCVAPKGGKPTLTAANKTGRVALTQVANRTTLASSVGVDVGFTVTAGALGQADLGANVLKHFDASKNAVSFLVTVSKTVDYVTTAPVAVTDAARALLLADAPRFLKQCGRGFITGMRFAAT